MPPGFSGFVEPGLSFSPEKTQIEFACEVAAKFSVLLPGGPITSLAKAALALAPARAAVQTATASNGILRIAYLPSRDPVASQASSGPVGSSATLFRSSGANCDVAHAASLGKGKVTRDDVDHWLASAKREEFFGPLGMTARTFREPAGSNRVGLIVAVPGHRCLGGGPADRGGGVGNEVRRCSPRDDSGPRGGVSNDPLAAGCDRWVCDRWPGVF
jgi:hypothetical protein